MLQKPRKRSSDSSTSLIRISDISILQLLPYLLPAASRLVNRPVFTWLPPDTLSYSLNSGPPNDPAIPSRFRWPSTFICFRNVFWHFAVAP
jgi:hypothetical protein